MSRRTRRPRPSFDAIVMAAGTAPVADSFPETRRFIPAEAFGRHSHRSIQRVVIHITSGDRFSGTFYWFRSPRRPIRRVFQAGAAIGKIFSHIYLRRADALVAGQPPGGPIRFAPTGNRRHEGLFDGTIHTLGDTERESVPVSAHYVVDRDGQVYQFVREADMAYHAGGANRDSIGIEHVCSAQSEPTDVQYQASARLVNYLCGKYNIPRERSHILGHQEADPRTDHNCPGRSWNWPSYMALVNRQFADAVATTYPTDGAADHERRHAEALYSSP